jgi:hypothetical protein
LTVENRREPSGDNGIPLFEMKKSYLHLHKNPGEGHCLAGSLTGEVASKNVTEAYKGWLISNGNRDSECKRISQLDCETYMSIRDESRC